ncbi:MAG: MurR/RpiR family transcriptional regulator [Ruminococcaceae bacterium]|nr:MurR/RpiR family transcriptional regulator [Oscillospiraceae bacterium]
MLPAVFSKIISMRSNFTMSENEIAQYVINNADLVATSTITTAATNTHTSEASINRFCKKLGYKGYNGFKTALAQESFYNSMKQQDMVEDTTVIASVTRDYRHMLANTSAMLDEDIIIGSVECIKQSKQIYIFSFSLTEIIAKELEFKLTSVGMYARSVTDPTSMHVIAANLKKDDLVIAIAPTIFMKDAHMLIETCKDHDVKVISITSFDSPKMNELVDYKFITSDKITAQNAISLSNNLIFLYVVDVIYTALLKSDKALMQKKLKSDAVVNNQQTMNNSIFDY